MCFVLNETGFFGRYTLYIVDSIFQTFSELKIAEKVNTKIMKRNRYHKLEHTMIFRGVIGILFSESKKSQSCEFYRIQ
jgi:16S rRNA C1402 N4-methylase RsmH